MANQLIKPAEFVKKIKSVAHKAAVKHKLTKIDEDRLLIAICASIGRAK